VSYATDLPHAALRWAGTTAEIKLSGELDLAFAEDLTDKLTLALGTCPEALVVDLTRVSFLDSTCVAFLPAAHRRAIAAGTRMVVVRPAGPTRQVLDLCELDQIISCVDEPVSQQSSATGA
jgi:anti-anti-sigma factor